MAAPKVAHLIQERKDSLDEFLESHLSFKECVQLQRKHLLVDLALNPVNAFWAIPALSIKKGFEVLDQLGWDNAKSYQQKIPVTIRTHYQKEIELLVAQKVVGISKISGRSNQELNAQLVREAQSEIKAYSLRQSAITDLTSSGLTYLFATWLFHDGSLNAFGLGRKLASIWAKDNAASNFFLGKSLGNAFYSIAPPEPTTWQVILATSLTLIGIGVVSTAVAVISIPLRRKLGLQKRSLSRLLDSIHDKWVLKIAKENDTTGASYRSS
jgi:hypothetical protein